MSLNEGRILFEKARISFRDGNASEALNLLKQAEEVVIDLPSSDYLLVDILDLMAKIHAHLGEYEKAVTHADSALIVASAGLVDWERKVKAAIALATIKLKVDLEESIELLLAILEELSEDEKASSDLVARVHLALGGAMMQKGDLSKARVSFYLAQGLFSANCLEDKVLLANSQILMAKLDIKEKEFEKAELQLKSAIDSLLPVIKESPITGDCYATALDVQAQLAQAMGNMNLACDILAKNVGVVAKIHGDYSIPVGQALVRLGEAIYWRGNKLATKQVFERVLEIAEKDMTARSGRMRCLAMLRLAECDVAKDNLVDAEARLVALRGIAKYAVSEKDSLQAAICTVLGMLYNRLSYDHTRKYGQ